MLSKEDIKKLAAIHAASYLQPGMTLGVGTGSTVYFFIQELARKIKEGLACTCVPTSTATSTMAAAYGITMVGLNEVDTIDLTIDGADEIDPQLQLIKGGGGALLQEKMVAAASDRLIIIADQEKLVDRLGAFPLPVEVIPWGWKQADKHIREKYAVATALRIKDGQPLVTDHGHYILDCRFGAIPDPAVLTADLNTIPGVVENGLFVNLAHTAIVAYPDGTIKTITA